MYDKCVIKVIWNFTGPIPIYIMLNWYFVKLKQTQNCTNNRCRRRTKAIIWNSFYSLWLNHTQGRAMVQAVSRRPLTAEARVRSRASPCGICGGQSGTGTGFSPSTSVLPCQFHSTGAPLLGRTKKLIIFLFIFITGLHNKPQGCGASVASAAGTFSKKIKHKIRLYFTSANFLDNKCKRKCIQSTCPLLCWYSVADTNTEVTNMLNKQLYTTDKGWLSVFGAGRVTNGSRTLNNYLDTIWRGGSREHEIGLL
jgi:hypothetical protein